MMLAIVATTLNKLIVVLDFQLNKNYIASALCVNRDKPRNCCHGKCFLKKQLQKEDDQGKSGIPVSKDKSDVSLYCEHVMPDNFNSQPAREKFCGYYLVKKYSTVSSRIFHPPGKI